MPKNKLSTDFEFSASSVDQMTGIVTAYFTNGKHCHGSLIIGADGINSNVRKSIYPDNLPIYCGYSYYRAVMDLPISKNSLYPFGGNYD